MLSELNIKNIALIEKLNLQFYTGLNILSGETGAGKSIIIDSLNFALGERADKTLIRHGESFATVEAIFSDYNNLKIDSYLQEIGFDLEEILVVSRKMTIEGKNECRINGRVVTLSTLKGLTSLLADIIGQHEHQSLLNEDAHILLLDSFESEKIELEKEKTKILFDEYHAIKNELKRLGDNQEREQKCDILNFQIQEIEKANIQENEENELLEKRKVIRNQEKILSALSDCIEQIDGYESENILSKSKIAFQRLESISDYDKEVSNLSDRIDSARIEMKDISESLKDLKERLNFDERSAEELENRLETVRKITKKYGGNCQSVFSFLQKSKEELQELLNADDRVLELENKISKVEKNFIVALDSLTKERKSIAKILETKITKELVDLGMKGSIFAVQFENCKNDEEKIRKATQNGVDVVTFMISPNVGEPLKPLAKIISGGEMSRFMLALKNIVCTVDGIQTMVFDEIDTGISGHIAEVVACKLMSIAHGKQVLAVTHLPQLASMADSHYLIEKHVENGKTVTNLHLLENNLEEIARLIGGSDYSGHAIPHAKEMREWSNDYKSKLK